MLEKKNQSWVWLGDKNGGKKMIDWTKRKGLISGKETVELPVSYIVYELSPKREKYEELQEKNLYEFLRESKPLLSFIIRIIKLRRRYSNYVRDA